mmetsp:Transcript_87082/g.281144  ORF Transcript_87082/g.281144 Transcript_87082/m.281144 type:complete len:258 (-) Transcript_87082:106-879(-)
MPRSISGTSAPSSSGAFAPLCRGVAADDDGADGAPMEESFSSSSVGVGACHQAGRGKGALWRRNLVGFVLGEASVSRLGACGFSDCQKKQLQGDTVSDEVEGVPGTSASALASDSGPTAPGSPTKATSAAGGSRLRRDGSRFITLSRDEGLNSPVHATSALPPPPPPLARPRSLEVPRDGGSRESDHFRAEVGAEGGAGAASDFRAAAIDALSIFLLCRRCLFRVGRGVGNSCQAVLPSSSVPPCHGPTIGSTGEKL